MSLLTEYEHRTAWKYQPLRGAFHTAEGLADKVGTDGRYRPFPGSTVVFRPDRTCAELAAYMQRFLHHHLDATGMLADALPRSTLHMTLHDLVSPEQARSAPGDGDSYGGELRSSLERAARAVEALRREPGGQPIAMAADRVVNMVSKSIVLMLKPRGEGDFERLMQMYRRFDDVAALPYPLTPHVTLAYFRPGAVDGDILGRLLEQMQPDPKTEPSLFFYPQSLTAQAFSDMANYADVPTRICFVCDGGMNRSVMAASLIEHLAAARGLPVVAEARSAFPDTRGTSVPEQVRDVLARHGVRLAQATAQSLEDGEAPFFSSFAAMTDGALSRVQALGLPGERIYDVSRFFFGVRDPAYDGVTHEQVFFELSERAERCLDALETKYREYMS